MDFTDAIKNILWCNRGNMESKIEFYLHDKSCKNNDE